MTTKSQLKSYARTSLSPELGKRGFALTPKGFAYARAVGPIWHILIPEFGPENTNIRMVITAWVPEWALQPYDLSSMPNGVNVVTGGRLGKGGPSDGIYEIWPAATKEECLTSFRSILELLDVVGIPWLNQITTREALVTAIKPTNAVDRFGNKSAEKVFGKGLLYASQVKPIG